MKNAILICLFASSAFGALPNHYVQKLADVIYRIEGGSKTHHPYGIKSIKTNGDVAKARQICINTIVNTHKRWIASGRKIHFVDYLANRYCPVKTDKRGNSNWKRNVHRLMQQ